MFAEYADIVLWLANAGVEVLRLDAIAFLWKRLGTNCQNQPEVHAIAQALRALLRIACPAVLLKAEAIVAPDDLVHYLGQGRHHGKVSDLAYHNTLMVQVWSMLASPRRPARGARAAGAAAASRPRRPGSATCAATTTSAGPSTTATPAAVGLTGSGHRAFLSDFYIGLLPRQLRAAGWCSRPTRRPATGGSAG